MRLFASTIAGNVADNGATGIDLPGGGGIYLIPSDPQTVELYNTVFAENYVSRTTNDCGGSPLTSFNYNYIQSGLGCLAAAKGHDLSGGDIWLGPLQDNGGPTPTRALLTGLVNGVLTNSPALDQIPPDSNCRDSFGTFPVPDQRAER